TIGGLRAVRHSEPTGNVEPGTGGQLPDGDMSRAALDGAGEEPPDPRRRARSGEARRRLPDWLRRFLANGTGVAGFVGVVIVVAVALAAPALAPHDPSRQYFDGLTLEGDPLPPSSRFPIGTDLLGRDLLPRVVYGARVSLLVGVVGAGPAALVGIVVGVR